MNGIQTVPPKWSGPAGHIGHAGSGFHLADGEARQHVSVPDVLLGRYARNKDIVFMRVNGESMNNVIEDGAVIAVLTEIEANALNNGDIVVASMDFGYTVKRFL